MIDRLIRYFFLALFAGIALGTFVVGGVTTAVFISKGF